MATPGPSPSGCAVEDWLLLAVHQGDSTVRVPPFEAVELDLAGWWVPEAT